MHAKYWFIPYRQPSQNIGIFERTTYGYTYIDILFDLIC
jgi:hypothetical protein